MKPADGVQFDWAATPGGDGTKITAMRARTPKKEGERRTVMLQSW